MMWLVYTFCAVTLSHQVGRISKNNYFKIFFFMTVIFMTPSQLEISVPDYAPSIFTFFFDFLFRQEFSTRTLRPLLLSIPLSLLGLLLFTWIRRKFF
jgi:hypothetical protein